MISHFTCSACCSPQALKSDLVKLQHQLEAANNKEMVAVAAKRKLSSENAQLQLQVQELEDKVKQLLDTVAARDQAA